MEKYRQFVELARDFISPNVHHRYALSSIYYDTVDLAHFAEKEEGLEKREKLRLRTYSYGFSDFEYGFIEIKYRDGEHTGKVKIKLSKDEVDQVVNHNDWSCLEKSTNQGKYLKFVLNSYLQPVVKICYLREAFVGNNEEDFRVTFDSYVSAFRPNENIRSDYFSNPNRLLIPENCMIMEIKTNAIVPQWYFEITRVLNLERRSISKYNLGILSIDGISEKTQGLQGAP